MSYTTMLVLNKPAHGWETCFGPMLKMYSDGPVSNFQHFSSTIYHTTKEPIYRSKKKKRTHPGSLTPNKREDMKPKLEKLALVILSELKNNESSFVSGGVGGCSREVRRVSTDHISSRQAVESFTSPGRGYWFPTREESERHMLH